MSEIPRTMSFDSPIEWMEAMCDLMCGGVEEDETLTDIEQCILYSSDCEDKDCSKCDRYEEDDLICDTEGDDY